MSLVCNTLILLGVTANFVHQGTMKNLQNVTILLHWRRKQFLGGEAKSSK